MAENLLIWPPYRVADVVHIQNAVFSYGRDITQTDLYKGTIDQLERLAEKLYIKEQEFFQAINVSGLAELQRRLDTLNSDPGFAAMTTGYEAEEGISNQQLVQSGISWGEIGDVFDLSFSQSPDMQEAIEQLFPELQEIEVNDLIGFLQEHRKGDVKRIYKSHSIEKLRGLSKVFGTICPKYKDGKVVAEVTLNKRLSKTWKQRLEKDYNLLFENMPTQQELLWGWLDKNIKNEEIKSYVKYQFDKNISKYDLNRSHASVKGFLGEVKTNAFFCYLMKDYNATIPTGNIINMSKKEIPIDMVLKGFNFQIKNYTIDQGETLFSYEQGADSFVESRMAAESPLKEILIGFFGSYTYNKPVDSEGGETYKEQVYERFNKALNGTNSRVTDILDLYLDDIMKVGSIFQTKNSDLFSEEGKKWYNTFFVIGSTFVPSSAIVYAMREELENKYRTVVKTNYTFQDKDDSKVNYESNDLSEQGLTNLKVWPGVVEGGFSGARHMANRVKIKAEITLNIPMIMESAVRVAARFGK